jgi:hypothetical protein
MFLPQEDRFNGASDLKRISIMQVIGEAETLLDRVGWINRNPVGSGRTGYCLGSAIATVVGRNMFWTRDNNTNYHDVAEVMLTAMQKQTGRQWGSMPEYNDAPGRTREDIRTVMKLAREMETV